MNWIKLRDDLKDDPSVLQMANALKMDVWAVIGRLSDIWAWVGRHTVTGEGVRMDDAMIDLRVRKTGFAAAMRKALWLGGRKGALCFPHWERHNANSCKARLLGAEDRKGRLRPGKASATENAEPMRGRAAKKARPKSSAKKRALARQRTEKTKEKEIREEERTHMHSVAPTSPGADAAPSGLRPVHVGEENAAAVATVAAAATTGGDLLVLEAGMHGAPARIHTKSPRSNPEKSRGTLAEMTAFCGSLGLSVKDAEHCFYKWEGSGWRNNGRKIACWRSTIRSWMAAGYLPARPAGQETSRTARGAGSGHRPVARVASRTYDLVGRGPESWDPMSGQAPPSSAARSRAAGEEGAVPFVVRAAVQTSLELQTVASPPSSADAWCLHENANVEAAEVRA